MCVCVRACVRACVRTQFLLPPKKNTRKQEKRRRKKQKTKQPNNEQTKKQKNMHCLRRVGFCCITFISRISLMQRPTPGLHKQLTAGGVDARIPKPVTSKASVLCCIAKADSRTSKNRPFRVVTSWSLTCMFSVWMADSIALNIACSQFRSCVKVEVDVLGSRP